MGLGYDGIPCQSATDTDLACLTCTAENSFSGLKAGLHDNFLPSLYSILDQHAKM